MKLSCSYRALLSSLFSSLEATISLLGPIFCDIIWARQNPNIHLSLKVPNVKLNFEVSVLGQFLRRKLIGRI